MPALPDRISCDEAGPLAELCHVFPNADIAQQDTAAWPVDIELLFAAAATPIVALANGGHLHIAEEEAATLIDVDTGSPETGSAARNAMAMNLAAAAAVATHRLRRRHGQLVREEVARTLVDPAQVDAEVHALCDALIAAGGRVHA